MGAESAVDLVNWGYWKEQINQSEDLSELDRRKASTALDTIRRLFGEGFLEDAFANRHPITSYLLNSAPWTRKWLAWFGEALEEMECFPKATELFSALRSEKRYLVASEELWASYKLLRAGFRLEFYPEVEIGQRRKKPDIRITTQDGSEILFVEVTGQRQSQREREASETFDAISRALFSHIFEVEHVGRVLKPLSKHTLEEIGLKLENMIDRVKTEGGMRELVEEDTIEIAFAPKNQRELLTIWAKEHGIESGSFSGPAWNVDEIWRAKRKIESEQKQLPHNALNLIAIHTPSLFLTNKDIKRVISLLEESIYDYDHVVACVLYAHYISSPQSNEYLVLGNHVYMRKQGIAGLLSEEVIILLNRFARTKTLSPATFTSLIRAFTS